MTGTSQNNETRLGVLSSAAAYSMWGLFPLYFLALRGTAADEILSHRILWSVPFGALIITLRSQWPEIRRGLTTPFILMRLAMAAGVIAVNWLIYIIAVQNNHIFEASLGYYINPLMYVLVGVVVLKERLRQKQLFAVVLAATGVAILTVYGGKFPLVSVVLAASFTAYGFIRKRTDIGAMPGLFIETLLLSPIAGSYLLWLLMTSETGIASGDTATVSLLVMAGPITVLPLLLFAIGARRLTLATLGFLQFIGPTLQFMIGLIEGEPFTRAHQICFGMIWLAAALFAYDAWQSRPRAVAARAARAAGPSARPVK
ncbi:EamA family transporter RarD [Parvularcula sp. LCG005]|uniref:EamA family transporter RarD n=1 Tax=Parvularcula sp. LCG005 TaxID=3078805 RepID=UPI002943D0A5|nr:EamA family transporter RarD [Parvularcula sp. LCG005]WOI53927.1 EamA family transporter RarD [Parvularcula sp. LCG005]